MYICFESARIQGPVCHDNRFTKPILDMACVTLAVNDIVKLQKNYACNVCLNLINGLSEDYKTSCVKLSNKCMYRFLFRPTYILLYALNPKLFGLSGFN